MHITRMVFTVFEHMQQQQQHDCIALKMAGKDEEKIVLNFIARTSQFELDSNVNLLCKVILTWAREIEKFSFYEKHSKQWINQLYFY